MSKVIAYSVIRTVVVGVPFTWGTRNAWAIKVESGGMYYLSNGKKVLETEEGIIDAGIFYAGRIEIK
ncbi:unknown function [Klebsiella phage vB_Kpl_K71PH129C1]|uniref:Uncharacterized protein n=1 Tax=Klebsiella phage vB_Kpl_K71PH129C1 TaxID=3071670 RepID=A0AAV1MD70_9CAUD|nr:unknown function [Klebsiella phage vB_Kpl_K71PH129C1]